MRRKVVLGTALLLAGCANPTSQTEQGTGPGLMYFPDIPPGAHVMIDGADAGLASAYDARRPLSVTPGTHRVVVSTGGAPLIDKKYYVNAGTKLAVRND